MLFGNAAVLRIILVVLMINYGYVGAYRCFQCRSDLDKSCASSSVSKSFISECKEPEEDVDDDDEIESSDSSQNSSESGSVEESPPASRLTYLDSTSSDSEEVVDSSDSNQTSTSKGTKFHCRKIVQDLIFQDRTIVIRECAIRWSEEGCKSTKTKMFNLEVCECFSEACNRASTIMTLLHPGTLTIALTISTALIFPFFTH